MSLGLMGIGVEELAVILIFGIPLVAIVGGIFLAALRILRGGPARGGQMAEEESQLVQELYQGLQRMERRIETLETLLLDRERKGQAR